MPEIESTAFALTVPLLPRMIVLGVTLGLSTGGVASRLIVTDCVDVPPALVALQVMVMLAVSVLIVVVLQPVLEGVDSASVTLQLTMTLLVYQPFVPSVPVTVGVIIGGVLSCTAKTSADVAVDAA
jgi:hypothetical protein